MHKKLFTYISLIYLDLCARHFFKSESTAEHVEPYITRESCIPFHTSNQKMT